MTLQHFEDLQTALHTHQGPVWDSYVQQSLAYGWQDVTVAVVCATIAVVFAFLTMYFYRKWKHPAAKLYPSDALYFLWGVGPPLLIALSCFACAMGRLHNPVAGAYHDLVLAQPNSNG